MSATRCYHIPFLSDTYGVKGPNPFARKTQENGTASNNPFLRKPGPTKSVTRSDSFFEKVIAAEDESEMKKSQSRS